VACDEARVEIEAEIEAANTEQIPLQDNDTKAITPLNPAVILAATAPLPLEIPAARKTVLEPKPPSTPSTLTNKSKSGSSDQAAQTRKSSTTKRVGGGFRGA
jgi:hypothetical protein